MSRMTMAGRLVLLAAGLALLPATAMAQAYPSKTIRIIVPAGPGGGADLVARVFGEALSAQTGVPVVSENRPGAAGMIGATAVAQSPPDGYTLLLGVSFLVTAPPLVSNPTYDPVKDFAPVARVVGIPMMLAASGKAPFNTFEEMVAYAKANPGKLNYATSGKGAPSHLEMELLERAFNIDLQDIPYKSGGQAVTDTISGEVMLYFPNMPQMLPHVASGALKGLAVGTAKRSPAAPAVPTLAEIRGKPGTEAVVWYGFLAPAGTPPEIVDRLSREFIAAVKNPSIVERLEKAGVEMAPMAQAEFAELIRNDSAKWTELITALGIKAE
jgi:tripartite-type tricarboxylate transporter receptor subunit TctC